MVLIELVMIHRSRWLWRPTYRCLAIISRYQYRLSFLSSGKVLLKSYEACSFPVILSISVYLSCGIRGHAYFAIFISIFLVRKIYWRSMNNLIELP